MLISGRSVRQHFISELKQCHISARNVCAVVAVSHIVDAVLSLMAKRATRPPVHKCRIPDPDKLGCFGQCLPRLELIPE